MDAVTTPVCRADKEISVTEIYKILGISRATLWRYVKVEK
jgi:predicted DNA-binding transcriptional regulator AlpA